MGVFCRQIQYFLCNLSKENIDYYFTKNSIDKILKDNFIKLIKNCEFARYAPKNNQHKQMQETLNKAKEIIIEVESNLKKK